MLSKQNYDNFVSALNSANIKEYCIRCEGGNRLLYHNGTSSVIVPKDDHIVCIERTKNYGSSDGIFNVIMVPYDNIDDIKINDITFVNGITVMESLGCRNDEVNAFLKQAPMKRDIIPGTAGLDSIKVDNKPAVGSGSTGYVTD